MVGRHDFTITNCYFDASLNVVKNVGNTALFDGNFIRKQTYHECQLCGDVTNNYFLTDPADESNTSTVMNVSNVFDNQVVGNVFHYLGTISGNQAIVSTENGSAHTITVKNNICVASSGAGLGLGQFTSNNTTDMYTITHVIEHNTVFVGSGAGMTIGAGVGMWAGAITSLRSNAFWRTGGALGGTYACDAVGRSRSGRRHGFRRALRLQRLD